MGKLNSKPASCPEAPARRSRLSARARICLLLGLAAAAIGALAAPGDFDPTFGVGGIVNPRIGPSFDEARAIVRQPDGKLIVAGDTLTGTRSDLAIARYLPDGALDPSFGMQGRVRVLTGTGNAYLAGLRLQPDGRIVVSVSGAPPVVKRFTSDGSPDLDFGSAGTTILQGYKGGAIDLQGDGGIVVAAASYSPASATDDALGVVRLTAAGAVDTSFGNGGAGAISFGGPQWGPIAVQPDGRILVTGTGLGSQYKFYLARFLPTGQPDTTFGTAGQAKVELPAPSQVTLPAMALQSDGKILLTGNGFPGGPYVVRLNIDGSADSGFGSSGMVTVSGPSYLEGSAILQEAGGRIVLAMGIRGNSAPSLKFRLVGLTPSGGLDPTFPGGGVLEVPGTPTREESRSFVPLPVGGYAIAGNVLADFAIKVVGAGGLLDASFGIAGTVVTDFLSGRDGTLLGARTTAEGKIVAVAQFTTAYTELQDPIDHMGVARFNADGSFDPTFGSGGQAAGSLSTAPSVSGSTEVRAFALQPDGKIVVAGRGGLSSNDTGAMVMRFNADGTVDTGFGDNGRRLIAFKPQDTSVANAVTVLDDGTIVVAGFAAEAPLASPGYFIARFSASGEPDTAFAPSGAKRYDIPATPDIRIDAQAGTANRIAVAGSDMGSPVGALRLLGDGSGDPAFGFSGAATMTASMLSRRVLLQPDGGVVVVGSTPLTTNPRFLHIQESRLTVARFTAAGQRDTSFGTNGVFQHRFEADGAFWNSLPAGGTIRGAALTPSGRVLVGGDTPAGPHYIAWVTPQGTLDPDLTRKSIPVTTLVSVGGRYPALRELQQISGKLLIATDSLTSETSNGPFYLARVEDAPDYPSGPLAANPATLDFGGQSMNTTSPPISTTLTNTSGTPITVTGVTASSGYAVASNTCAGTVAAAATCAIGVTFTPPVAGVTGPVPGTLTVTYAGGPTGLTLAGTAERSLVTHYYRSILRRAPDSGGKVFWENEATRVSGLGANVNETWYALAQTFYFSGEYAAFNRDNAGYVTDLYSTFFNRAPDSGGSSFWVGQLDQGMPREVALASFLFSGEFGAFTQAIFGNTAVRAEIDAVTDFYRGLLARLPDNGGFNFWIGRFRTAQCQGQAAIVNEVEAISSAFAVSGEYTARGRSNSQYVGDLYNAFLRRGGDLGGVQYWINQIAGGFRTREQVRIEFKNSPEFQGRVNAIVNQGCMT